MKRLTGPTPDITDQRDAFDVLEGYPRKSENIGAPLLPFVPPTYSEGAFGWTGHAFAVNEVMDDETGEPTGTSVIFVPDDLAAEHDGETVELPDGRMVTIDLSGAVDVQTERMWFPMQAFTQYDGDLIYVRPQRVTLVAAVGSGTQIRFPDGDFALVTETFAVVRTALVPAVVDGLITLNADDGLIAVNPRYVLSVTSDGTGARVVISGGLSYDVTEGVDNIVDALSL
jgi:hypothetical protein